MDVEASKQRSRESWGMGEYGVVSAYLRPAARALADACAVSAGQEVLDIAAGDGNFAVACAEEGASVVASDLSSVMVERGRIRSEAEGVDIEWVEADVESLPFEDGRFECVGSVFGAMIAPRPSVAAQEMFRVARPGNTVGMTAWIPEGPINQLFRLTREYAPPPDDQPAPEDWADEEHVRERFGGLANSIEVDRHSLQWTGDSPEDFVAGLERGSPVQVATKANLDADTYGRMRADMLELVRSWSGGDGPVVADAPYVVIVARRRG